MRVIYPNSDLLTFKRLLVIADEIHFTGHNMNVVSDERRLPLGYSTEFNEYLTSTGAVRIFPPPPRWGNEKLDSGEEPSPRFDKLVTQFVNELPAPFQRSRREEQESLERVVRLLLRIQTWCAIRDCVQLGAVPLSESITFDQLLMERMLGASRNHPGPSAADPGAEAVLRLKLFQSVVPDELIEKLHPDQILNYREKAKDAYVGWTDEVRRLQERLAGMSPEERASRLSDEVIERSKLKVAAYRAEMTRIQKSLFASLLQNVTTWQVPVLAASYATSASVPPLLLSVSLLATLAGSTYKSLIDYQRSAREVYLKHPISYLMLRRP